MPYIEQEKRPKYDLVVNELDREYLLVDEINYILFEYCKKYISPSYNNYKNFCGELRQCATEIARRNDMPRILLTEEDMIKYYYSYSLSSIRRVAVCDAKVHYMGVSDIKVNGDLNYILYAYCMRKLTSKTALIYNRGRYRTFAVELLICANRIEDEILATYEDKKIEENGDVE